MSVRLLPLAIICTFFISLSSRAETPPAAARIEKLVKQLGSDDFAERESASKELDDVGAPALESLKKTIQGSDLEAKRRAEDLIGRIEKRLETARIMAPTKVKLSYKDTPLKDAVADFAKKSGIALVLQDGDKANSTVTLETEEVPFWQALDQFCAKVGLVEVAGTRARGDKPPKPKPGKPMASLPAVAGAINLKLGKPEAIPTYYSGAARFRILQGDGGSFMLSVAFEPRMQLEQMTEVRLAKGADDKSHAEKTRDAIRSAANELTIPISVQAPAKDAKTLKEVAGTFTTMIRSSPEPVMTVDDVLKSAGQEVKGKDGDSIAVKEISKKGDGSYQVRVEMHPSTNDPEAGGTRIIQIRGGVVVTKTVSSSTSAGGPNNSGISLVDADGKDLGNGTVASSQMRNVNGEVTREFTLIFKPDKDRGAPAKLVYSSRRLVTVEIPFEFKDVPLK